MDSSLNCCLGSNLILTFQVSIDLAFPVLNYKKKDSGDRSINSALSEFLNVKRTATQKTYKSLYPNSKKTKTSKFM